jgi:hypothetical protein
MPFLLGPQRPHKRSHDSVAHQDDDKTVIPAIGANAERRAAAAGLPSAEGAVIGDNG